MNKLLLISLALVSITACKKKSIKDVVEVPRGFNEYTIKTKSNDKKNLLFFHLHHCPNCTLVQNHLISSDAFQDLTKNYNRYFLELGTPLGKKLMEKYSIRGAPVFILTDKDFSQLSTSSYGLQSLTGFNNWLSTGEVAPPKIEIESYNKLVKKYELDFKTVEKSLYKLFSILKDNEKIELDWKEFISHSDQLLTEWSNSKLKTSDKYANYYRTGLSYINLAELAKVKLKSEYRPLMLKALKEYEKINSGNIKADAGSYIFQIAINIRLENDIKVEELIKLLEKGNPTNKTILYSGAAYSYLNSRNDCEKVFEYTSKMKLKEIPTPADRIYQVYFRAQCHEKTKDLNAIKIEYENLLNHLGEDYQKSFPDKLRKIEAIIKKLETEAETMHSLLYRDPEIQCTILDIKEDMTVFGLNLKKYDSIRNQSFGSQLTIAGETLSYDPITIKKTSNFEKIEISNKNEKLVLEIFGKPISRKGHLSFNGQKFAQVTCH